MSLEVWQEEMRCWRCEDKDKCPYAFHPMNGAGCMLEPEEEKEHDK